MIKPSFYRPEAAASLGNFLDILSQQTKNNLDVSIYSKLFSNPDEQTAFLTKHAPGSFNLKEGGSKAENSTGIALQLMHDIAASAFSK